MRRSRLDVICSLLSALEQGPVKPTPLMSKANLSHELFTRYMADLETARLVRRTGPGYVLTDEGKLYMQEYRRFLRFSASFGI